MLTATIVLAFAGQIFGYGPDENLTKPTERGDAYGDPLPEGALARFGTTRLRHVESTLAFSLDGRYLAVTGHVTKLFDAATGKLLRSFDYPADSLLFTPDRETLITASSGRQPTIKFWNLTTGKERRSFAFGSGELGTNFEPLCFSADGKRLHRFRCSHLSRR